MLFERQAVFGYFLLLQKVTEQPPFRKAKQKKSQQNRDLKNLYKPRKEFSV
jgi:hypothetical protein